MKSFLSLVTGLLAAVSVASAADTAVLLPADISLSSKEARQTLIVQRRDATGESQGQISDVKLTSSDDKIVRLEGNQAIPVANGKATITARGAIDGQSFEVSSNVTVTKQDEPFAWSFRNHVESVLSKQGCNAGSCHGARAGQKGFRLTLFGFDVDADYSYLTRQAVGRRIVPSGKSTSS